MHISARQRLGTQASAMGLLLGASTAALAACSLTSASEWCVEQGMAAGTGGAEANDQLGFAVASGAARRPQA